MLSKLNSINKIEKTDNNNQLEEFTKHLSDENIYKWLQSFTSNGTDSKTFIMILKLHLWLSTHSEYNKLDHTNQAKMLKKWISFSETRKWLVNETKKFLDDEPTFLNPSLYINDDNHLSSSLIRGSIHRVHKGEYKGTSPP